MFLNDLFFCFEKLFLWKWKMPESGLFYLAVYSTWRLPLLGDFVSLKEEKAQNAHTAESL